VLTYLVRHGRTSYSASYRVNGRPDVAVPLDEAGIEQCRVARRTLPVDTVATCVVSRLPRTAQTASLLLEGRDIPVVTDGRLDEIDYGAFEGDPFVEYGRWLRTHGPWCRPPGSLEGQREAILRMLDGLRDLTEHPGPRLVVAHGLLLSIVKAAREGPLTSTFFPEAPYLAVAAFTDDQLITFVDRLTDEIHAERGSTYQPDPVESLPTGILGFVTVSPAGPYETVPPEEEDHHA
jgi:probable phosphoglycerate mutase